MCALTGFFSGCDRVTLAEANDDCSNCKFLEAYKSHFGDWDAKSSVRSRPRRILGDDLDDPKTLAMPKDVVPVLSHPAVINKGSEAVQIVSIHHLYRYLKLTTYLEALVVGRTVTDIATGAIWSKMPDKLVLDAHRIIVDEAYHALFTTDLLAQVRTATGIKDIKYRPIFLDVLDRVIDGLDQRRSNLARLYFVIISETLITGVLKIEGKAAPSAIADSIQDHLNDEWLHHAFFRQVLFALWPGLSKDDQDFLRPLTHIFIRAFLMPDLEMVERELISVGFAKNKAKQICEESYAPEKIDNHVREATSVLRRYLRELGIEEGEAFTSATFRYFPSKPRRV